LKLINICDSNLTDLYKFYLILNKHNTHKKTYFISKFFLYIHKKLHYYNVSPFEKQFIFSNGRLLHVRTKLTKFFKKSRKSYGASITALNKYLKKKMSKINFFFCKNFNYKNYLWLKKLVSLVNPQINYFMVTGGWTYVHKYRRRIKKKILRNLIKNSFIV
jgi:hypothetical protein